MARKGLMDAVSARLGADWHGAPIYGVNGGKWGPPEDGSSFVAVQYPFNSARQLTFGAPGANVWREEGGIRFVLALEPGTGDDVGFTWADEIAALFRGKEFDGVQCFAPTSPVIDDDNDIGSYFVLTFVVPYQFDLIG